MNPRDTPTAPRDVIARAIFGGAAYGKASRMKADVVLAALAGEGWRIVKLEQVPSRS